MVCCPRSESIRLAADLRSANSVFATQGNTHRPALALNGSFAVVVSGRIDYGCASQLAGTSEVPRVGPTLCCAARPTFTFPHATH